MLGFRSRFLLVRTVFIASMLLLFSNVALAASSLSLYGGAYTSRMSIRGDAGPSGQTFDARDELGYGKADQWVAWIGLEHDNAPWPKVQLHHSSLSVSGTGVTPIQLPMGSMAITVDSRLRVHATDLVLYYSIPNVPLELDLGGGVRRLAVEIALHTTVTRSPGVPPNVGPNPPAKMSKKTAQYIPVIYGSAHKQLPLKGTYAASSIVASRYKDRKLYNSRLALGWVSAMRLGVELGYNHQRHRFEGSESVDIDLGIAGPYAAVSLNF